MKVLSTTIRIPRRRARSPTAAMSVSCIIGLVGVSTNSIFVAGRNAAAAASVSLDGTNVNSSPRRRYTRSNSR